MPSITETFDYDGGRQVTAYVPHEPAELVVFAGDGQVIASWGDFIAASAAPPSLIVGVHRVADETVRLHEYSPGFDPGRFAAHERLIVGEVRDWVKSRFGVALPRERTATVGVSAGGELALALAMRNPDLFGAVYCASPGGGYRPPAAMPSPLPRAYFTAGTDEPWFRDNAVRWAEALLAADGDVVMTERPGNHGDAFWRDELPLMLAWMVGPSGAETP